MKMFKTFLLAGVIFCGAGVLARAEDEIGKTVGPGQTSSLGTFYKSTGTNRQSDTRRIATDQLGNLQTVAEGLREVIRSTGAGDAGLFVAGGSTNSFTVTTSSWVGVVGCRNAGDNCNMIRFASSSSPVYVDKVMWGNTSGLQVRTRVRLFDSQGTTSTALEFFNQAQTSGTISNVGYWCTSGTTIMITEATNDAMKLYLGKQSR